MPSTPVLIVGAGPTGLVLALSLTRLGIPCRIIDQAGGPGEASRAMVVQARTLEFYRQFAIAEAVIERGIRVEAVHLHEDGEEVARFALADLGTGLSPYPFALVFPQDDHERFLVAHLAGLGRRVEWGTALLGFTQDANGVQARLATPRGEEVVTADWLAGCDGAHSAVRQDLGLDFPGGTYSQRFYVADARIEGPFRTDLHATLDQAGLALLFPVRSSGMQRLLGIIPAEFDGKQDVAWEDVRPAAERMLDVRVTQLNWFSTYHVHHRVAAAFRVGRAFLAGDAGHIHSPAGAQGMNTGIGDAVNLGWKLAAVIRGEAPPALLESYEAERIGFARKLVATTDRAFQAVVNRGPGGRFLRHWVMPYLVPVLAGFAAARRGFFGVISQIRIAYPDSPLSEGKAGEVEGGERLPWVATPAGDNFAPLDGRGWRLQVHGTVTPALTAAAAGLGLPIDAFGWSTAADRAGLRRDAAYLLRPDGHVGLALADQAADRLEAYAARHGLRFPRLRA